METQVLIVNAFTDNGFGGNPAGVVLDADMLNTKQKLSIASKIGLSETAFVSSSDIPQTLSENEIVTVHRSGSFL